MRKAFKLSLAAAAVLGLATMSPAAFACPAHDTHLRSSLYVAPTNIVSDINTVRVDPNIYTPTLSVDNILEPRFVQSAIVEPTIHTPAFTVGNMLEPRLVQSAVVNPVIHNQAWMDGPIITPAFPASAIPISRTVLQPVVVPTTSCYVY